MFLIKPSFSFSLILIWSRYSIKCVFMALKFHSQSYNFLDTNKLETSSIHIIDVEKRVYFKNRINFTEKSILKHIIPLEFVNLSIKPFLKCQQIVKVSFQFPHSIFKNVKHFSYEKHFKTGCCSTLISSFHRLILNLFICLSKTERKAHEKNVKKFPIRQSERETKKR